MLESSRDITSEMFKIHFGTESYATITCKDCFDNKMRQCDGKDYAGHECLVCIEKHARECHVASRQIDKKRELVRKHGRVPRKEKVTNDIGR